MGENELWILAQNMNYISLGIIKYNQKNHLSKVQWKKENFLIHTEKKLVLLHIKLHNHQFILNI